MKIVIAGGSGHLGTLLADEFNHQGHEVVVLSRNPKPMPWKTVGWDGETLHHWVHHVQSAQGIINLAGKSVDCRYTTRNKKRLFESRLKSTRALGQAITQTKQPPKFWLQMSTATIYQHTYDQGHDETGTLGGNEPGAPATWNFSIELAKAWEAEAKRWEKPETRQVILRTAMVMSPFPGGVFRILQRLAKFGLGGKAGHGEQYVSWLHYLDFLQAMTWIVNRQDIHGIINLSAPAPLANRDFMGILRHGLGKKFGLASPEWLLELGAIFLRTETELLMKSRRVLPRRLQSMGFNFAFPQWNAACENLLQNGDFQIRAQTNKILAET